MDSIRFRLLKITAIVLLGGPLCAPLHAQTRCSLPEPPLPAGCQRERIQASGKIAWFRPHQIGKAAWEAQAKTRFGERFADFKQAACVHEECVKAGEVGVGTRCTYSAFPCSPDVTPAQLNALNKDVNAPLDDSEMKELADLLNKAAAQKLLKDVACKNCSAEQRRDKVLKAWRRLHNLPDDGKAAGIADLDMLRRRLGA